MASRAYEATRRFAGSDIVLPLERRAGRGEPRSLPLERTGRTLIPIAAATRTEPGPRSNVGAPAPFLAHLIATEQGIPQTRKRRQADPGEGIAAYTAMMRTPRPAAYAV